nr:DUF2207 domain-containing protein [Legionella sp. km772]
MKDNHSLAFAFMGYLILIIFYILSWFYLGQDPNSKVIIPLFEPPAGFSPQSLGYIKEMESSDKLFTAAIINMAVKKYLMIEETSKKEYRLKKIAADENNLTASEKAISQELFKSTPSILMVQANHSPISKAVEQFNEKLAEEFQKQYFILNTPIILLGIAISVVSLLPLLGPLLFHSFDYLFAFCIVGFYGFFFIESLIPHKIKRFQRFYLSVLSIILLIIILGIIFLPLIFDSLFGSNWLIYLLTALFITTNSLFRDLMRRPTPKGMDIVSQTLGFELFLKATEETQMNFRNPPDKTPQLFERYLPFALALGLEQSWSEQFSQILSESQYKPEWYSSRVPNFSSSHFSQSLGNSFTSAVCSARVAPSSSSSSGFGSGGFSGGGFGGGGGGGW